jgi:hypothetical protein
MGFHILPIIAILVLIVIPVVGYAIIKSRGSK